MRRVWSRLETVLWSVKKWGGSRKDDYIDFLGWQREKGGGCTVFNFGWDFLDNC